MSNINTGVRYESITKHLRDFFSDTHSQIINVEGFQYHIFLILIPIFLVIFFASIRRRFSVVSLEAKRNINSVMGLTLLSMVAMTTAKKIFNSFTANNTFFEFVSIFLNLDVLLGMIIAFCLIFSKFSIARLLTPSCMIFGTAFIIGNPGQAISAGHVAFDIALATIPFVSLIINNVNISFKSQVMSVTLNVILLSFVSVINNTFQKDFSNLSANVLMNNHFYSLLPSVTSLRIGMYIFITILFEVVVWVFIRALMEQRIVAIYTPFAFFKALQADINYETRAFLLQTKSKFDDMDSLDLANTKISAIDYKFETNEVDRFELFEEIEAPVFKWVENSYDDISYKMTYSSRIVESKKSPRCPTF